MEEQMSAKPLIDQFIIKGSVLLICAVSISTYAIIAFGTGDRFAQVIGAPCVGLIGIALGRMVLRIDPRTHPLLATGLLASLACLLSGEIYGVQSNFGSERGVYVDDARLAHIAVLSRKRAWRELIEYVERQEPTSDSDVLRELGRAHAMLGHVDEAEECYKKALAKTPLDVNCRYLLVRLYLKRGRVDDAEVECLRILNVSDSIPEAHMAYAVVLAKRGNDTNAAAEIARSLSLLPLGHPWKNMAPRSVLEQLLQSINP
jgi:tetratricopeptide (TPR) repeat protein